MGAADLHEAATRVWTEGLVGRTGNRGELPLREHLRCERARARVSREPRKILLARDDASRVLEVTHERGGSHVRTWHTAMERVELLEESDERMDSPDCAGAVVVEVAELSQRGELFMHKGRHVALDERSDAGAANLEKDERLHRRCKGGAVLAG